MLASRLVCVRCKPFVRLPLPRSVLRCSPLARMQRQLASSISLSQLEHDLFETLKATLVSQSLHDTELRCAGGWVRDKLLGKDSHDIDIALNNMQGEEFAAHVNNHLASRSEAIGKVQACILYVPPESIS